MKKGSKMNDAQKAKCARGQTKRYSDPAARIEQSERIKKAWEDPNKIATLSEAVKEKWNDPEYKAKQAKKAEEYRGTHRDPVTKEKISKTLTGIKRSPKTKELMSKVKTGANNGMYGKPAPPGAGSGKSSFYTRKDGKVVRLRSTYEPLVAFILDRDNIRWEYERTIELEGFSPYHIDFYLPDYDVWLEPKGYMRNDSRAKLAQFFIQYPEKNLRILYEKDIDLIIDAIVNDKDIDITKLGSTGLNSLPSIS
jgi:hypothetical protein